MHTSGIVLRNIVQFMISSISPEYSLQGISKFLPYRSYNIRQEVVKTERVMQTIASHFTGK